MSAKNGLREAHTARRARKAATLTVSRPELLEGGSDAEFRRLVHGLLAFATRLESVRAGLARVIGLSPIQYTILISVAHLEEDGDVCVNMLAEHLQLSGAFITIESGKLLKQALLTKTPDPADRRRVSLRTTPKARTLLESLAPTQVAVNDVLFEFLDKPMFRQYLATLDRMGSCAEHALSLLNYLSESRERVS
jgi:DNA-binding MarR family transcriptional regulator